MIRIAAIGLGNRTCKYLQYLKEHPDMVELVAVVEPDCCRRDNVANEFGIPESLRFGETDALWSARPEIDAVIIGTPDKTHFSIAMGCLQHDWHILLEKPAATTTEECELLMKESQQRGLTVCICYVLRYHPYYLALKSVLERSELGQVVSVDHVINVGLDRMAHTFVRGFWSRAEDSSPIILSKASHDIDLLYWLTGGRFVEVRSRGCLNRYRSENAPSGSAERCIDCSLEDKCPYSAYDLYVRRDDWNSNFTAYEGESKSDVVNRELREGRFGRCVYRCDNDVVDYQEVDMVSETGCIVRLVIDGLTDEDSRVTRFVCAGGEVMADGKTIRIKTGGREEVIDMTEYHDMPMHAGADMKIVEAFLRAVSEDAPIGGTDLATARHSHDVCFMAEADRCR